MNMDEPNEILKAAIVEAVLFTVGRAPMPVRERIAALLKAAEILAVSQEKAERAELELLWDQS